MVKNHPVYQYCIRVSSVEKIVVENQFNFTSHDKYCYERISRTSLTVGYAHWV